MRFAITLSTLLSLIASVAMAFGATSCDKDDEPTRRGGGGGGAWLVGADGAMINISPELEIGDYPLSSEEDFYDIACRGSDTAWVVGDSGTLLRSTDAGESWQAIDLATTLPLRAVAAAERDVVFVVGDAGLALVSDDSGDNFRDLPASGQAWTSVATAHDGAAAILGTAGGELWRYDGGLTRVHAGGPAIRAVGMSAAGRVVVAVGDSGLILRSVDGGTSWQQAEIDGGALHDVWVTGDGGRALAVGDGGRLIDITDAGVESTIIATGVALRGLHLSAAGAGTIVGDRGVALVTADGGQSWAPVDLGTDRTLYAVDDIHSVPHL